MYETKQTIYDELSRVLTECDGDEAREANMMYDMLVKIQNNWEDIITAD